MPLSPTAQRWARLLADQEQSNLTTRAFAAQHDVNPSTLNGWRCELRKRQPAFVEVRLATVVTPPPRYGWNSRRSDWRWTYP